MESSRVWCSDPWRAPGDWGLIHGELQIESSRLRAPVVWRLIHEELHIDPSRAPDWELSTPNASIATVQWIRRHQAEFDQDRERERESYALIPMPMFTCVPERPTKEAELYESLVPTRSGALPFLRRCRHSLIRGRYAYIHILLFRGTPPAFAFSTAKDSFHTGHKSVPSQSWSSRDLFCFFSSVNREPAASCRLWRNRTPRTYVTKCSVHEGSSCRSYVYCARPGWHIWNLRITTSILFFFYCFFFCFCAWLDVGQHDDRSSPNPDVGDHITVESVESMTVCSLLRYVDCFWDTGTCYILISSVDPIDSIGA
jgi:hypothetical protein